MRKDTPRERLREWTVPCADCATPLVVQVPLQGRQGEIAYLCAACLAQRVAQVKQAPDEGPGATPPPPRPSRRGRKKARQDPAGREAAREPEDTA